MEAVIGGHLCSMHPWQVRRGKGWAEGTGEETFGTVCACVMVFIEMIQSPPHTSPP